MSVTALLTTASVANAVDLVNKVFGRLLLSVHRSNPNEQRRKPMSDNRRYFYLKLKESFYNSETMVVLESMQDGLIYSNLLMKMYLMSLKNNGILMLNDHIPHSPQTIATFTRHQIGTVEPALKVFMELGLVEILTDGTYYMTDIQMLIGLFSTEGERKKRERMRLQQENLLPQTVVDICPPYIRVRERVGFRVKDRERVRNRTNRPHPFRQIQKCSAFSNRACRATNRNTHQMAALH